MNNDTEDKTPLIKDLLAEGHSLNELGKYNEAFAVLAEILKIDSKNVDALNNMGYSLHKLNKHNGALRAFDEALKIDPNNELALRNKEVAEFNQAKHLMRTMSPEVNRYLTELEAIDDSSKDMNGLNNKGTTL